MKAKFVCNIHNVVIFSIATTVIRLNTASTSIMGATPIDTFTASGPITATIQEQGGGNQTAGGGGGGQEPPYILGGDWNLNVEGGNVTDFTANFMMVHTDGTGYHTHNITSFNVGNATVQLFQGQETSINGTADVATNGTIGWPGVDTTLTFTQNGAVMTIMPAAEDTENHFQGQPIYGIVSQLTGENDTMIVQTTPPGQAQEGEEGEGGDGGILEPLTEPFQDLFGG